MHETLTKTVMSVCILDIFINKRGVCIYIIISVSVYIIDIFINNLNIRVYMIKIVMSDLT